MGHRVGNSLDELLPRRRSRDSTEKWPTGVHVSWIFSCQKITSAAFVSRLLKGGQAQGGYYYSYSGSWLLASAVAFAFTSAFCCSAEAS